MAAMEAETIAGRDAEPADGGAKRRQIMDGARAVFLSAGFDGASMNDIARAAGVSKGTLYAYFDSKEQLFEALIREERSQQAERLCAFPIDHIDPASQLHGFGRRLVEMMARPENVAQVRVVIAATGRFPRLGQAFYDAGPRYGVQQLAARLQGFVASGALEICDVERAARQFIDLCLSGVHKRLLFGVVDSV
ncbi:MAG: TetR/AcrR family transcriptional regulator, partial [Roseiarcus sp.]